MKQLEFVLPRNKWSRTLKRKTRTRSKLKKSAERMTFPEADRPILVAVKVEIPEQEARVIDHRLEEPVVAASRLRARARGARRRRRYRLRSCGVPGHKRRTTCRRRRRGATGGSWVGNIAGRARTVLGSRDWVELHGWRWRMCPAPAVLAATAAVARGGLFAPGRGRRLLLPELLAQPRVPEVLDLVVRPPGQPRRDLGPAAQAMIELLAPNNLCMKLRTCGNGGVAVKLSSATCCQVLCGEQ